MLIMVLKIKGACLSRPSRKKDFQTCQLSVGFIYCVAISTNSFSKNKMADENQSDCRIAYIQQLAYNNSRWAF